MEIKIIDYTNKKSKKKEIVEYYYMNIRINMFCNTYNSIYCGQPYLCCNIWSKNNVLDCDIFIRDEDDYYYGVHFPFKKYMREFIHEVINIMKDIENNNITLIDNKDIISLFCDVYYIKN